MFIYSIFELLQYIWFVYIGVLPAWSVHHVHAVSTIARREHEIPLRLEIHMNVLGIEPQSSKEQSVCLIVESSL